MNTLNNYITERIRINNIKGVFPIDGKLEDIIKFLEANGFTETKWEDLSIFAIFKETHAKQYNILSVGGITRLWFADTSNGPVSRNNPVFLIKIYKMGGKHEFAYSEKDLNLMCDKQEFIEMLNKRFGWCA